VLPYLILCPSTFTVIFATIVFFVGIIRLTYTNRHDVWLIQLIRFMTFCTIVEIDWRRVMVSLQIYLPINIWIASSVSAIGHLFFKWAFPDTYKKIVEGKEWQRRKWATLPGDIEGGIPGKGEVITGLGVGATEEMTLAGQGFESHATQIPTCSVRES
jgi:hypothetical protein